MTNANDAKVKCEACKEDYELDTTDNECDEHGSILGFSLVFLAILVLIAWFLFLFTLFFHIYILILYIDICFIVFNILVVHTYLLGSNYYYRLIHTSIF